MKRALYVGVVLAAVSGTLLPAGSASAAVIVGEHVTSDLVMSPSVVHYRNNQRFDTYLQGDLTLAADAPCNGSCRLTIGMYEPGENSFWRGYETSGAPGTSWNALDLEFPITRTMNPAEGVHRLLIKVYDSSDAQVDQVEAASLTVYKKLSFVPSLQILRDPVLEGRDMPFRISVALRYADGYQVRYFGSRVSADIQWSSDGQSWRRVESTSLTRTNPSRKVHGQVSSSGLYRLTVRGDHPAASSKAVRGKVWEQTKQARITSDSISSREVFRGRSVTLRGSVKAKYEDREWHAPVPGTAYRVQYRTAGSSRWETKAIKTLRKDGSLGYSFKPKKTGFVRFKVLGETSRVHSITVKPPIFDHVWVKWPRGFYDGDRVAFPSCAVSNTNTGLRGVELVLQWRSTRLNGWTTKDRGSTRKGGCVYLIDPNAKGGYFRVLAPKYGKSRGQVYS